MLAKKTSKNQITLPKSIADLFPSIQYFDVSLKNGKILFVPVIMTPIKPKLRGLRGKRLRRALRDDAAQDPSSRARKQWNKRTR